MCGTNLKNKKKTDKNPCFGGLWAGDGDEIVLKSCNLQKAHLYMTNFHLLAEFGREICVAQSASILKFK